MIGRMVLLSVFALVFLLALGLNRYLNCALAERRVARWLTRGLFVALIPTLLVPAAVIAINPTVPYPDRDELMLYVYLFYAGAGVALVCVVVLAATAGVIAAQRGDVRRWLKGSAVFVRRVADALRYGSRVWMARRASRTDAADPSGAYPIFRYLRRTGTQPYPSAFSDYLGREQCSMLGQDETQLDPFALGVGPNETGVSYFSLEDQPDD